MGYIRVPIETNPEVLAQSIFDYIQAQAPQWQPSDGNLDVWIIRAIAAKAAENRTLASDVPDTIFASLGSSLFAIPPVDAVAASGNTTWTLSDTNGHTIPANTFVGVRDANGDLVTFYTVADIVVAPGGNVTAAGQVLIKAINPGIDANGLVGNVELITTYDWVTSIALVSATSGGIEAETNDQYLNRLSRRLLSLSTVPVLAPDFARVALDADPGIFRTVAIDGYNPLHNLLIANEASAETDASGWASSINCTLASTAAQAASGTKSISLTAIGAGDMAANSPTAISGAGAKAVSPGQTVTGLVSIRSAATVRSCRVELRWRDAAGALLATTQGTAANDSTTAWTQYSVVGVAPALAAFVQIRAYVIAAAAAEVHYIDKGSIRHGTGTDWVAGGTAEINNTRMVTIAAVDINGNAVSSGVKTAIAAYIAARREVNFIVNVMDPKYTNMDAAATVKLLAGYNSTSVHDAVVTAITTYFNPANWGLDPNAAGSDAITTWVDQPVVYYNELITLISNVPGVDRVTDLTINIHGNTPARVDVPIDSPAGLTTVGTITATVV